MEIPRVILKSCPKAYNRDLDKAISPEETVARIREKLKASGDSILADVRRIDTGRLGIPVYLGVCGPIARAVMGTRKQMGKGSSPAQAEASAIMELMERFAFFSLWQDSPHFVKANWTKASQLFGDKLIPISEILKSVNDSMDEDAARQIMDLVEWRFYPATDLSTCEIVWLPLDWFRMLGEFNGSSAGNTNEESLLQGLSELVERHVCAIADRERPELPTIDASGASDPVLAGLVDAFARNGVNLVLKDMSLGMPLPTVAAFAWDPATYPDKSELVFTAGTASSPAKAAIRAITEVAQLGGDFCTGSRYEASGLPKFRSLEDADWLLRGPKIALNSLPSVEDNDIRSELESAVAGLAPVNVYAVETTHPGLGVPAHYVIAPGLEFRERDKNQSLALFAGRKLVEEAKPEKALAGLEIIAKFRPDAHFLPFFKGQIALAQGDGQMAARYFEEAIPLQPDSGSRALALFYAAYALFSLEEWKKTLPLLAEALRHDPEMKEAASLLGTAYFKLGQYKEAENMYSRSLDIDKGSAVDWANRGVARQRQGLREAAIADLEVALEMDPDLDFARAILAETRK